ncbi:MAG: ABC transporter substrate-binding protein [Bacteroidetes bacterium]|jgi:iron complex transport system substrate-binding protein|nr:ABC transporter substrate-binding protein [Bacteroidota bacterium]MBT6687222.1 ABC transporter substrate-binding protein [Bacteroidota bacterium]MBT7144587.1 ABC transporter substrate-binding protein [Bacteroidota bacterium]MBT7490787.1 ABC transporter substrate-binding protein [Bacteroidota bacterium]
MNNPTVKFEIPDIKFQKYFSISFFLNLVFLFASCNFSKTSTVEAEIDGDFTNVKVEHSKGFEIRNYEKYKKLLVFNPWQGAKGISYEYILSSKSQNNPTNFSKKNHIKTPVERVICLSTTHVAMIDFLDKQQTIVGISDHKQIFSQEILQNFSDEKISEVGSEINLNFETIVKLNPDVVFIYGVGSEALNSLNKLQELNIQPVIIAEYLENTPLGKAEWLKFFALFFDKLDFAEKEFSKIESEYCNYKQLVEKADWKPIIMTGLPWKDTWFVGGGNSFAAKFIGDAGGNYLWKNNLSHESLALSIESAFEKSADADIWINIGIANSAKEISAVDSRFKQIAAIKNKMLFNNNARQNLYGGNDYWESGIVNPHLILKDLIHIFHPEILPQHKLFYYKPIF